MTIRITLEELAQRGGFAHANDLVVERLLEQTQIEKDFVANYVPPKVTWRTRYAEAKRRLRDAYAVLRHGAYLDNDDMW